MARQFAQKTATLLSRSGSLGANATVSASLRADGFAKLVGVFRSDIASETGSGVRIEQGTDGTNWDIISSSALATACAASGFNINVIAPYVRFIWKNGATAASTTRAELFLRPI